MSVLQIATSWLRREPHLSTAIASLAPRVKRRTAPRRYRQDEVRSIHEQNAEPQVLGQIDIASFINPAGLKSMGKNLFMPTAASGQANETRPGTSGTGFLAQGELEGSNVNIVDEMVNMISAQRAYETNSKVVQTSDQMMQTAVNIK